MALDEEAAAGKQRKRLTGPILGSLGLFERQRPCERRAKPLEDQYVKGWT